MASDIPLFLGQLLRKPGQVVALAPSSAALAQHMAQAVPDGSGAVVELGPGTGKITRALLGRGIAASDLHLFELNPDFASHLRDTFPETHIHITGAQNAVDHMDEPVRAVVSGLPLLSMPNHIQDAIVGGAFQMMGRGGVFIQFTYGPVPPINEALRKNLGLRWDVSRKIWGNLPPARVYTFRQSKV